MSSCRKMAQTCKKYLFHFAHEHLEFRLPEVKSIASVFGIHMSGHEDYDATSPCLVVSLPSDDCALKIMSRTVLVKSLYEVWGQGSSYEELYSAIKSYPSKMKLPYISEDKSFSIRVDSFNRAIPFQEKIERIEDIPSHVLKFEGKVNLKNPDVRFLLFEVYGPQGNEQSVTPQQIYFGRWLGDGQRGTINDYHLQKRKYIGNTSMDAGLSFIMANMGKAKENSFVYDPFVGTGSLLVACARYGSYVMGTDIDYKLLHGIGKASRKGQKWRGPDENIRSNLRQYGLDKFYIDALVADSSLHSMWRQQPLFDAIITDPPYGIREPAKKVGTHKEDVVIPEEQRDAHISSTVSYQLTDIFKDLLNFSAKYLKLGGRLVYWLPVYRPEYSDAILPVHGCFHLVANSEQVLSANIGRRLVTMEKVLEYQEESELVNGAEVVEDHYGDHSFRNKYFQPGVRARKAQERRAMSTLACDQCNDSDTELLDRMNKHSEEIKTADCNQLNQMLQHNQTLTTAPASGTDQSICDSQNMNINPCVIAHSASTCEKCDLTETEPVSSVSGDGTVSLPDPPSSVVNRLPSDR